MSGISHGMTLRQQDRVYWIAQTVINKIVFTSPEAMVKFSGEKNKTSTLVKTL